MKMSELCLCGSSQTYALCCAPYHLGESYPDNAEKLMRSRYCAYVKHNIPYIVNTTVPAQQQGLDQKEMQTWSETTDWVKLEVVNFKEKVSKIHSQVEFKAYFNHQGQEHHHHELSTFTLIEGKWYFLDPTVEQKTTMKQPCICGSGKKFKQCCATFLG